MAKKPTPRNVSIVSKLARQRARLLAKQNVLYSQLEDRSERLDGYARAMRLDRELLRDKSKTIERLEAEIERAREYLRYTSALTPERMTIETTFDRKPYIDIATVRPVQAAVNGFGLSEVTFRRTPINVLAARLHPDQMRGTHHMRVAYADRQWGYAFERYVFRHMPIEEAGQMMARELGLMIVNELSKYPGL